MKPLTPATPRKFAAHLASRDAESWERSASRATRLNVATVMMVMFNMASGFAIAAEPMPIAETTPLTSSEADAAAVEFFEKKVHPLLVARCYECHGPDAKQPKGGLRLDSRGWILKGGESGPALVPGEPGKSLLIEAINYESFEMPPRSKLPAGEIAIFTEWVKRGARWPTKKDSPVPGTTVATEGEAFPLEERRKTHWAWQPVRHYDLPDVTNADWPQTRLDRFILARLEEKGLQPAPPADRRTLIRRVSFDLIGLPPTPEEVEAFVQDSAPTRDALAKVVDRLLESPHFGERWARHWLDLVRYAETLGHEFDYPLHHAYQYRDYVIRAFNADVPYNQFVLEHIASDLLEKPRLHPTERYNESIIGTGFWFLGEDKHAPVDVRGEEAAKIDNQLDVFSKTFLGLTVACARCHDHKFDAISTKDYYALAGFLRSSRRQEALLDPHGRIGETASKLRTLREQADRTFASAIPKAGAGAGDDIARYFLAAWEAMHGEPKPADENALNTRAARPDIVFDDFEAENYRRWTVEGKAFGPGPVAGTLPRQQPVSGFLGKRLVNSYVGGDDTTGKLISQPFVVNRRQVRFLVGGGAHRDRTCINLRIGDKVVRTATGKNNERLEPHVWEVSDFDGREAVLEIIDAQTGGWGHINVDHIVFTDAAETVVTRRPIAVVANERGLDAERLKRWVTALSDENVEQLSHPLSAWVNLAGIADKKRFADQRQQLLERCRGAAQKAEESLASTVLFEDFNGGNYDGWFVTGWAFGEKPTQPRQWKWNSASNGVDAALSGVAHSGVHSPRLQGVLRSPSFTITHPQILYRIAGKNAQVRLIIDGYVMDVFNGLLFRGVSFDVNTDGRFTWFRQAGDVQNYLGHRAHIEIIDHGDGWVAVDEIRFANLGPDPEAVPTPLSERVLHNPNVTSRESLAAAYAALYEESLREWQKAGGGNDDSAASTDDIASARNEFINWSAQHGLIDFGEAAGRLKDFNQQNQSAGETLPAPMKVIAITDGTPGDEHVFIRGSHKNFGPRVPRRMLEAISGAEQSPIAEGSGRLELATRLLDPANPFPARVAVNRVWHHLFGRGIVASVDNFGVLGEPPSHLELLDDLAGRFVNDGWSLKRLIREIVLSSTYQMASSTMETNRETTNRGTDSRGTDSRGTDSRGTDNRGTDNRGTDNPVRPARTSDRIVRPTNSDRIVRPTNSDRIVRPTSDEIDPQNVLLHRMPIRRLQGEAIRDAMLLVSGRLDRTAYGSSVPIALTPFMQGRGRPAGGPLDGNGRRSVYISVNRNFLSPMMLAFDTPIPFNTMGRRNVSNVPAQALILLNDPFVVQQARVWAERLLAEKGLTPDERIRRLYLDAFARPPSETEQAEAAAFLQQQSQTLGIPESGWQADPRVWADLCHVLFNVKEFIFLN